MRRLGRDAAVYGLGVLLTRAVSFVMLPVYTRFLTPADYGLLQLLQMVIDVTAIVFSAGVTSGVMRFYYKAQTQPERDAVMATALLLLGGLNLVAALALVLGAPWIAGLAIGGGEPGLLRIAACTFFFEAGLAVPMLLLQVRQLAGVFMGLGLVKLLLQLGLNIVLVVMFGWGVRGVLLSSLVASALFGSALAVWMLRQTGLRFSAAARRDLRRFGVPYQLAAAGTFILTFGDRYFLEAWHGLAAVGLYGLAYQFGFLLSTTTAVPYFRAWTPQRLQLAEQPREVRDAHYNQGFLYLNLLVVTAALGICLFIRPLLDLMSAPAFHGAATLVPVLLASFVLYIWSDAVSLGIDVSEQTRFNTYATWLSVVVILALYALLIPPFGGMGAAVATLLGFALRFGFVYVFSQRLWPISWRWAPQLRLTGYAAALTALSLGIGARDLALQLVLGSALFFVYAAAVWADILGRDERRVVRGVLASPWKTLTGLRTRT